MGKLTIKELRIGNSIATFGHNVTVTAKLLLAFEENPEYIQLYQPIALTEDSLFKFGFEQVVSCEMIFMEYFKSDKTWFKLHKPAGENSIYQLEIYGSITQVFPAHVHSLQNLYFALAGEELQLINK